MRVWASSSFCWKRVLTPGSSSLPLVRRGADEYGRIKDKHGLVPAEYLTNVEEGGVDKEIQRALAIATAEFVIGGNRDDVASDDEEDGKGGSGSGSGSE